MATKAVIDAMKARAIAQFTSCPIYFPNEATTIPADLSPFVVVENPIGRSEMITIGTAPGRGFREEGGFRFVVHVPLMAGYATAYTYADECAVLFRGLRLDLAGGPLDLWAPGPPIPLGEDGSYYKLALVIPYTYHFKA